MAANAAPLSSIKDLMEKGDYRKALHFFCLYKSDNEKELSESDEYKKILSKLRRKAWMKGDDLEFKELAYSEKMCRLAVARLTGAEALKTLANEETMDGKLAKYTADADLKKSLQQMRRIPELKTIAEGWIALLKGDIENADNRFLMAEKNQPYRAKVGRAVVMLLKEKKQQAKELLKPIIQHTKFRFPVLASYLKNSKSMEDDTASQLRLIYQGSFSELKAVINNKRMKKSPLYPWFLLRQGDLLAEQGKSKNAIIHWNEALFRLKSLKADTLKRRYHLANKTMDDRNLSKHVNDLYADLQKNASAMAREFLETLVFDNIKSPLIQIVDNPQAHLQSSGSLNGQLTSECALLAIAKGAIKLLDLEKFNNNPCYEMTANDKIEQWGIPDFDIWKFHFSICDPEYGSNLKYLKLKMKILNTYQKWGEIRETACKILLNEPLLKNEFLPVFEQTASRTARSPKTQNDVLDLQKVLPNSFELARIRVRCGMASLEEEMDKLSASQSAALKFQAAIDRKEKKDVCAAAIPAPSLLGRDEYADARVLYCLTKSGKFNSHKDHDFIAELIKPMFSSSQRIHRVFQHLDRVSQGSNRLWGLYIIVRMWASLYPNEWHPYYYAGMLEITLNGNFPPIRCLEKAQSLMCGSELEYQKAKDKIFDLDREEVPGGILKKLIKLMGADDADD